MAGIEHFASEFSSFESSLNGARESSFHKVRKEAITELQDKGFPKAKEEAWKYTNLKDLLKLPFLLAEKPGDADVEPAQIEGQFLDTAGAKLVFVDGYFSEALSETPPSAKGVTITSLAKALSSENAEEVTKHLGKVAPTSTQDAFVQLNTAFVRDGAFIRVEKNVVSDDAVQLLFVRSKAQSEKVAYPRILIVAEESSSVRVIEKYISLQEGNYFSNPVTEVSVADNARVDHYKIQEESEESYHISRTQVRQGNSSFFSTHLFSFGGKLVRNEVFPVIDGEGSELVLNGLTILGAGQHIDNHTIIDHAKPHCLSHELFKGVYGGDSRGVFSGTIIVREDAQKTNAIQSSNSLLLTSDAHVDTQPQLKIWADDVRCTHGATIGQLNDDALFYLRSRGIGKELAEKLLIQAFSSDVLEQVKFEPVQTSMSERVLERLEAIR